MVFGWKKKAPPAEPERMEAPREIDVSDIGAELDRLSSARRDRLVSDAKSLVGGIGSGLGDMLGMVEQLEREELIEEETDRHIRAIVDRGKRQVIAIIRREAKAGIPDVREYPDVIEANREAHRILKIIGDVLGRQTRVIHIFAKKYATRLKSTLSTLNSKKDELAHAVRDHESFELSVRDIRERIIALDDLRERALNSSGRVTAIVEELRAKRKVQQGASEKISTIMSTPEFAEHSAHLDALKKIDAERAVLDREIGGSFARISRPLSKYVYVTSLDKEKKTVMARMLDEPATALRESGPDIVLDILVHVRKAVSSGSVSVKDISKSEEQIDAVSAGLEEFVSRMGSLESRKGEIVDRVRSFDSSQLDSARATLERTTSDIASLESHEREIRADAVAAEAEIPSALKALESRMRAVTSVAYTVRMPDIR